MLIAVAILLGIAAMILARRGYAAEFEASRDSGYRWLLPALLGLHGLLGCYIIRTTVPGIDCFTFQRDAAATLLRGRDPYGTSHADVFNAEESRRFYAPGVVVNGRIQEGLPYPPVTFLSAMPGYLLGDVRYGYLATILLSAILVFALLPDARGLWLAAFILLAPTTYYVEMLCWTEPLVWALLCATVYAAVRRPRWLPLALGLFLASKQYNVLALPLIGYLVRPFSWKAYWKLLGQSLAIAMVTVLPFALWNFHAVWHDLFLFHLASPVRHDAISFVIPFPIYAKIGPLLLLAFMVWAASTRAQRPAMFAAVYGMTLMLFFVASKQAFLNYDFLIANAFLLAAAPLWPVGTPPLRPGAFCPPSPESDFAGSSARRI